MNERARRQRLMEALIWICIYGGLLGIVAAMVLDPEDGDIAVGLASVGVLVTLVGLVLIYIRSRMK